MRTLWLTLLLLSLCWMEPARAQRGPDQPLDPPRPVEVDPQGDRGTGAPDAEGGKGAGGVTIGEPQTIGRPQVIGSPQVIGTPQVIGGERAGGEFPERESQTGTGGTDLLGEAEGSPDTSQGYGGSSDLPMEAGSGTGGSESWVPGQDQLAPDAADSEDALEAQSGTGGSLLQEEDPPAAEVTPADEALDEDGDADPGWMPPEPDEESWGGTGWMQPDADAPAEDPAAPGVGGSGAPGPTPGPGDATDGGSAGDQLLSPGLVIGPHDPETGALIDPRTGQPRFAQSDPDATAPGQPAQPGDTAASQTGAAAAAQPSREAPPEDALDSLTEMNEASLALEEAQLEVLESQLAWQEAAEAARRQEDEAAALAARQRLVAARMLEEGQLALQEGETDLSGPLAEARDVLVQELGLAQSDGRYGDLRELSEALERLDAAEVAADANNGLEARRWLLEARRLLVGPAGRGPGVETQRPYP